MDPDFSDLDLSTVQELSDDDGYDVDLLSSDLASFVPEPVAGASGDYFDYIIGNAGNTPSDAQEAVNRIQIPPTDVAPDSLADVCNVLNSNLREADSRLDTPPPPPVEETVVRKGKGKGKSSSRRNSTTHMDKNTNEETSKRTAPVMGDTEEPPASTSGSVTADAANVPDANNDNDKLLPAPTASPIVSPTPEKPPVMSAKSAGSDPQQPTTRAADVDPASVDSTENKPSATGKTVTEASTEDAQSSERRRRDKSEKTKEKKDTSCKLSKNIKSTSRSRRSMSSGSTGRTDEPKEDAVKKDSSHAIEESATRSSRKKECSPNRGPGKSVSPTCLPASAASKSPEPVSSSRKRGRPPKKKNKAEKPPPVEPSPSKSDDQPSSSPPLPRRTPGARDYSRDSRKSSQSPRPSSEKRRDKKSHRSPGSSRDRFHRDSHKGRRSSKERSWEKSNVKSDSPEEASNSTAAIIPETSSSNPPTKSIVSPSSQSRNIFDDLITFAAQSLSSSESSDPAGSQSENPRTSSEGMLSKRRKQDRPEQTLNTESVDTSRSVENAVVEVSKDSNSVPAYRVIGSCTSVASNQSAGSILGILQPDTENIDDLVKSEEESVASGASPGREQSLSSVEPGTSVEQLIAEQGDITTGGSKIADNDSSSKKKPRRKWKKQYVDKKKRKKQQSPGDDTESSGKTKKLKEIKEKYTKQRPAEKLEQKMPFKKNLFSTLKRRLGFGKRTRSSSNSTPEKQPLTSKGAESSPTESLAVPKVSASTASSPCFPPDTSSDTGPVDIPKSSPTPASPKSTPVTGKKRGRPKQKPALLVEDTIPPSVEGPSSKINSVPEVSLATSSFYSKKSPNKNKTFAVGPAKHQAASDVSPAKTGSVRTHFLKSSAKEPAPGPSDKEALAKSALKSSVRSLSPRPSRQHFIEDKTGDTGRSGSLNISVDESLDPVVSLTVLDSASVSSRTDSGSGSSVLVESVSGGAKLKTPVVESLKTPRKKIGRPKKITEANSETPVTSSREDPEALPGSGLPMIPTNPVTPGGTVEAQAAILTQTEWLQGVRLTRSGLKEIESQIPGAESPKKKNQPQLPEKSINIQTPCFTNAGTSNQNNQDSRLMSNPSPSPILGKGRPKKRLAEEVTHDSRHNSKSIVSTQASKQPIPEGNPSPHSPVKICTPQLSVKRGVGRPRRDFIDWLAMSGVEGKTPGGRGRGRPRSCSVDRSLKSVGEETDCEGKTPPKRGRGRPRSSSVSRGYKSAGEETDMEEKTSVKRGRGRPRSRSVDRGTKSAGEETDTETPFKGGRGRPRSSSVSRDYKSAGDETEGEEKTSVKRGRGRPRSCSVDKGTKSAGEETDAEGITPIKRGRGRPRSSSVSRGYKSAGEETDMEEKTSVKRGRGRPRSRSVDKGTKSAGKETDTEMPFKGGRGRPRSRTVGTGTKSTGEETDTEGKAPLKRSRGRPRSRSVDRGTKSAGEESDTEVRKGRGRPRSPSVERQISTSKLRASEMEDSPEKSPADDIALPVSSPASDDHSSGVVGPGKPLEYFFKAHVHFAVSSSSDDYECEKKKARLKRRKDRPKQRYGDSYATSESEDEATFEKRRRARPRKCRVASSDSSENATSAEERSQEKQSEGIPGQYSMDISSADEKSYYNTASDIESICESTVGELSDDNSMSTGQPCQLKSILVSSKPLNTPKDLQSAESSEAPVDYDINIISQKRGKGRSRKKSGTSFSANELSGVETPKRGKGRPKKRTGRSFSMSANELSDVETPKQGRGRARQNAIKSGALSAGELPDFNTPQHGKGRLRKSPDRSFSMLANEHSEVDTPKGRGGRLLKKGSGKSTSFSAAEMSDVEAPKRCGRKPKKSPIDCVKSANEESDVEMFHRRRRRSGPPPPLDFYLSAAEKSDVEPTPAGRGRGRSERVISDACVPTTITNAESDIENTGKPSGDKPKKLDKASSEDKSQDNKEKDSQGAQPADVSNEIQIDTSSLKETDSTKKQVGVSSVVVAQPDVDTPRNRTGRGRAKRVTEETPRTTRRRGTPRNSPRESSAENSDNERGTLSTPNVPIQEGISVYPALFELQTETTTAESDKKTVDIPTEGSASADNASVDDDSNPKEKSPQVSSDKSKRRHRSRSQNKDSTISEASKESKATVAKEEVVSTVSISDSLAEDITNSEPTTEQKASKSTSPSSSETPSRTRSLRYVTTPTVTDKQTKTPGNKGSVENRERARTSRRSVQSRADSTSGEQASGVHSLQSEQLALIKSPGASVKIVSSSKNVLEFKGEKFTVFNDVKRETFTCGVCSETYKNKKTFGRHLYVHLKKDGNFQCPFCTYSFKRYSHLEKHLSLYHRQGPTTYIKYIAHIVVKESTKAGTDKNDEAETSADYVSPEATTPDEPQETLQEEEPASSNKEAEEGPTNKEMNSNEAVNQSTCDPDSTIVLDSEGPVNTEIGGTPESQTLEGAIEGDAEILSQPEEDTTAAIECDTLAIVETETTESPYPALQSQATIEFLTEGVTESYDARDSAGTDLPSLACIEENQADAPAPPSPERARVDLTYAEFVKSLDLIKKSDAKEEKQKEKRRASRRISIKIEKARAKTRSLSPQPPDAPSAPSVQPVVLKRCSVVLDRRECENYLSFLQPEKQASLMANQGAHETSHISESDISVDTEPADVLESPKAKQTTEDRATVFRNPKRKTYTCGVCDSCRDYERFRDIFRHMLHHTKTDVGYECPHCKYTADTASRIEKHMKDIHKLSYQSCLKAVATIIERDAKISADPLVVEKPEKAESTPQKRPKRMRSPIASDGQCSPEVSGKRPKRSRKPNPMYISSDYIVPDSTNVVAELKPASEALEATEIYIEAIPADTPVSDEAPVDTDPAVTTDALINTNFSKSPQNPELPSAQIVADEADKPVDTCADLSGVGTVEELAETPDYQETDVNKTLNKENNALPENGAEKEAEIASDAGDERERNTQNVESQKETNEEETQLTMSSESSTPPSAESSTSAKEKYSVEVESISSDGDNEAAVDVDSSPDGKSLFELQESTSGNGSVENNKENISASPLTALQPPDNSEAQPIPEPVENVSSSEDHIIDFDDNRDDADKDSNGSDASSSYEPSPRKKAKLDLNPEAEDGKEVESATPNRLERACGFCGMEFDSIDTLQNHYREIHAVTKLENLAAFLSTQDMNAMMQSSKSYSCKECDKVFSRNSELLKHMERHKKTEFRCDICSYGFDDIIKLDKHLRFTHLKPSTDEYLRIMKPFLTDVKCNICEDRVFPTVKLLEEHIITEHYRDKTYLCGTCNGAFITPDVRKRHEIMHASRKFQCVVCHELFLDSRTLSLHMSHHDMKSVTCQICGEILQDKRYLKDHMRKHSSQADAQGFECGECGKTFTNASNMRLHFRRVHSGETPYSCTRCPAKFHGRRHLDRHLAKHTGNKPNKCNLCLASFVEKNDLKRHIETNHRTADGKLVASPSKASPGKGSAECPICSKKFLNKELLKKHSYVHGPTGLNSFVCEVCGKSFPRVVNLEVHRRRFHSGDRPFECPKCDKKFFSLQSKNKHVRRHSGTKDYKCDQCEYAFFDITDLKRHKKVHIKPNVMDVFPCDVCPKKFPHIIAFKEHRSTVHGLDDGNKCHHCGQKFPRTDLLLVHLNRIHSENHDIILPAPPPATSEVKCSICEETFPTKAMLAKHYSRVHPDARPYVCQICKTPFKTEGTLKIHERIHTGDRPYKCTHCPKSFTQSGTLRSHVESCHNQVTRLECEVCNKVYSSPKTFKLHQRTHDPAKNLVCPICSKAVLKGKPFEKHLIRHQKNGENTFEKDGTVYMIESSLEDAGSANAVQQNSEDQISTVDSLTQTSGEATGTSDIGNIVIPFVPGHIRADTAREPELQQVMYTITDKDSKIVYTVPMENVEPQAYEIPTPVVSSEGQTIILNTAQHLENSVCQQSQADAIVYVTCAVTEPRTTVTTVPTNTSLVMTEDAPVNPVMLDVENFTRPIEANVDTVASPSASVSRASISPQAGDSVEEDMEAEAEEPNNHGADIDGRASVPDVTGVLVQDVTESASTTSTLVEKPSADNVQTEVSLGEDTTDSLEQPPQVLNPDKTDQPLHQVVSPKTLVTTTSSLLSTDPGAQINPEAREPGAEHGSLSEAPTDAPSLVNIVQRESVDNIRPAPVISQEPSAIPPMGETEISEGPVVVSSQSTDEVQDLNENIQQTTDMAAVDTPADNISCNTPESNDENSDEAESMDTSELLDAEIESKTTIDYEGTESQSTVGSDSVVDVENQSRIEYPVPETVQTPSMQQVSSASVPDYRQIMETGEFPQTFMQQADDSDPSDTPQQQSSSDGSSAAYTPSLLSSAVAMLARGVQEKASEKSIAKEQASTDSIHSAETQGFYSAQGVPGVPMMPTSVETTVSEDALTAAASLIMVQSGMMSAAGPRATSTEAVPDQMLALQQAGITVTSHLPQLPPYTVDNSSTVPRPIYSTGEAANTLSTASNAASFTQGPMDGQPSLETASSSQVNVSGRETMATLPDSMFNMVTSFPTTQPMRYETGEAEIANVLSVDGETQYVITTSDMDPNTGEPMCYFLPNPNLNDLDSGDNILGIPPSNNGQAQPEDHK